MILPKSGSSRRPASTGAPSAIHRTSSRSRSGRRTAAGSPTRGRMATRPRCPSGPWRRPEARRSSSARAARAPSTPRSGSSTAAAGRGRPTAPGSPSPIRSTRPPASRSPASGANETVRPVARGMLPAWSPDGKRLVLATGHPSEPPGCHGLWIVPTSGEAPGADRRRPHYLRLGPGLVARRQADRLHPHRQDRSGVCLGRQAGRQWPHARTPAESRRGLLAPLLQDPVLVPERLAGASPPPRLQRVGQPLRLDRARRERAAAVRSRHGAGERRLALLR